MPSTKDYISRPEWQTDVTVEPKRKKEVIEPYKTCIFSKNLTIIQYRIILGHPLNEVYILYLDCGHVSQNCFSKDLKESLKPKCVTLTYEYICITGHAT